ncbi:MAG: ribosomal protein S18-alanine N-acetyltransferase [Clostridia bacterium]
MIQFREMDFGDIKQVMDIETEVYKSPWNRMAFINELRHNKYASYYILEEDDVIIAYGGIWNVLDEAHITNIAVKKDLQKQGYGKKMLDYLEKKAYEKGANAITLEVRASNTAAQALYEKNGYTSWGIRPKYYTDNNEDAVIMWKTKLEDEGNEH